MNLRKRSLPRDQLIMGKHAIREVLLHAPHRILQIFSGRQERGGEILELARENAIPVHALSDAELERMVQTDSHQSLIARVRGRTFLSVADLLERGGERGLILMLDQIFDPQNFGAALRSAECFGVDAVVWSKNRGCDLTPAVSKASCGASELLALARISNLAEAVVQFQKGGFEVVAAVADPTAENLFQAPFTPRTVLIVGSEGEGIQPLIRKRADRLLFIPTTGKIGSLNVAQATSVLLAVLRNSG